MLRGSSALHQQRRDTTGGAAQSHSWKLCNLARKVSLLCAKTCSMQAFTSLSFWHGPTLSFKDLGMQVLATLLSYFLRRREDGKNKLNLLVGTSGDTGSSAIEAVRHIDNISICVLYPVNRGISKIQELQITTPEMGTLKCTSSQSKGPQTILTCLSRPYLQTRRLRSSIALAASIASTFAASWYKLRTILRVRAHPRRPGQSRMFRGLFRTDGSGRASQQEL